MRFAVLLVLAAPALAANRPLVAVLDLKGNLPADDLQFFTSTLRDGVVAGGRYQVQSKQETEAVLQQQRFNCSDQATDCGVEAGRVLQVGWLVSGQIRRSASGTYASLTLLEVETSGIVASLSENCAGCDDAALASFLHDLGRRLVGGGSSEPPGVATKKAAPPPGAPAGSLAVESMPAGGDVLLDGVATGLKTPVLLANVPAGTHEVTVTKAGFADARREATVLAGGTAKAHLDLARVPGHLVLTSPEIAAACTLDGGRSVMLGAGGLEDVVIDNGDHDVACEADGFLPSKDRVSVGAGATVNYAVKLEAKPTFVSEKESRLHRDLLLGCIVAGAGALVFTLGSGQMQGDFTHIFGLVGGLAFGAMGGVMLGSEYPLIGLMPMPFAAGIAFGVPGLAQMDSSYRGSYGQDVALLGGATLVGVGAGLAVDSLIAF